MLSLPDHLTQIVTYLRTVIARILPPDHRPVWQGPSLYHVLANRVGRHARLVARLHALWQAGRLPRPRLSRAGQPRPAPSPASTAAPRPPRPTLSRAHGWLLRKGDHTIVAARSMLDLWLQRPDTIDFIAAVPQAGRQLRPLCRMLAVPLPPALRLPPRPRPPARPRRPSLAMPGRLPPLRPPSLRLPPGDRPLPPNVLAFARAERKKQH